MGERNRGRHRRRPTGNVYVADWDGYRYAEGADRIQKFTSSGIFIIEWGSDGTGDGQFLSLSGIATDPAGNVYAVDEGNNRIQKFTFGGALITKWGTSGYGDGEFGFDFGPRDVAIGSTGDVYVSDSGNDRIQQFTSSGEFIAKWGNEGVGDGQFNYPFGIAIDASANVYVVDWGNNRIQKFSSDGRLITKWGSYGSGDGQFNNPVGIATDAAGNVYVADADNNRIQVFTSDGTFITKWGGAPTSAEPSATSPAPRVSRPRITIGPKVKTTSRSATFRFSSDQSGARFQCKLTGRPVATALRHWRPCASPERYNRLRPGRKVFWVRAVKSGSTSTAETWSWTIIRRTAGRKPLVLPTTRRRATFRASCGFDYRCRARVNAKAGRKVLACGRYSVPAHSSRKAAIGLTAAGRKVLASKSRIRAKLTIVNTRTGKREALPVVLRRR